MKHPIILLAIGFLGIANLYSQTDYRKGFIVNNNNDTIYGLIDYKGNKSNAKRCYFKFEDNSESQIFTPDDIISYRFIDSKFYVSKWVESGDEEERLFLELLIKGNIDVYYFRDNLGEHYLIDNGTGKLYELSNEREEIIIDNRRYYKESKKYIGLLRHFFRDSPSIYKKINSVNLNHNSLIKITQDYHNEVCPDVECIIYEKKLRTSKKYYGLLVGLNVNFISEVYNSPERYYYLRGSFFKSDIYPSIGIFYKRSMPYFNEKLFFQYEVTYSSTNLKTSNSYIEPSFGFNYLNDITLTQNAINNSCLIRYEFPKGKIRPTLQAGIFANYFFNSQYNRNLEVKFSWDETYFIGQTNESPFTKFDYGINLGIGIKRQIYNEKEIFLDLKYQRGFGILEPLNTNTFLLNVGFQIGR